MQICARCGCVFEEHVKDATAAILYGDVYYYKMCSNCLFEYFELGNGFKKMAEDFDRGVSYGTDGSVEDD